MRWSYSRVDCFNKCPYQFKLRYLDKLKTIDDFNSDDALRLGTVAHESVEIGIEQAMKNCLDQYPISSDQLEAELLKIELIIPSVMEMLPKHGKFETPISDGTKFIGYIDYLYEKSDGTYGILDFKYTKDMRYYKDSRQIHIYKYYVEKLLGYKVSEIGYFHILKTGIRQKKDETARMFQTRIKETVGELTPKIILKSYDPNAIEDYWKDVGMIENTKDFTKNEQFLCNYCEYKEYCKNGDDSIMLPKKFERKNHIADAKKRVWIYGMPFTGKSTLANKFPKPYFFSTDGNAVLLDAPYEIIMDKTYKEGRLTKTSYGWEQFKSQLNEIETGEYDIDTIVLDLVEDFYKLCETYVCDKLKVTDVSDAGYGKGWNVLRREYLTAMKKLLTINKNVVLISHEDYSKSITRRNGDEFTAIKPNINDKVALKLAGMVDIVIRTEIVADKYLLNFSNDSVIFGGGRLNVKFDSLLNEIDSIDKLYSGIKTVNVCDNKPTVDTTGVQAEPVKRTRRKTTVEENNFGNETSFAEVEFNDRAREEKLNEATKTTTRRRTRKTHEEHEKMISDDDIPAQFSGEPSEPIQPMSNQEHEELLIDDNEPVEPTKSTRRRRNVKPVEETKVEEEDYEEIIIDEPEPAEPVQETERPRRRRRNK